MSTYDVWILRFQSAAIAPSDGLQRVFGIDEPSAREIEQTLPRVVKHGAHAKAAGEMRKALESIGAIVECRPARTNADVSRTDRAEPVAQHAAVATPYVSVKDVPEERADVELETTQPVMQHPSPDVAGIEGPPPNEHAGDALLAAEQTSGHFGQGAGMVLAGSAIIAIGLLMGNSAFRGEASILGIVLDGLAIYCLGVGARGLYTAQRS